VNIIINGLMALTANTYLTNRERSVILAAVRVLQDVHALCVTSEIERKNLDYVTQQKEAHNGKTDNKDG